MGLFGRSKTSKERKEARKTLKQYGKSRASKMTSTSDPSKAITELQPWQVGQEKPRQGLSTLAHKDVWGREIVEPDLTNPTRSRWERPLDTIRSFQEAVDRGYRRSYVGGDDTPVSTATSQVGRGGRNEYPRNGTGGGGGGGGGYYEGQAYHRMDEPGTPMTNGSHEQLASFGAMSGRVNLNDSMVAGPIPNHPAMSSVHYRMRGQSGGSGSGGYADTGYGESVNLASRDHSSVNQDSATDMSWNNNNYWAPPNGAAYLGGPNQGGNPYTPLGAPTNLPPPHHHNYQQQQQQYPTSNDAGGRNVIKVAAGPSPAATAAVKEEKKTRKSWLGKRLSKH